ncbi:hypothetical protein FB45DRAFT_1037845 [Roridomyces roridus]|uniref:Uncharacterized protein n=1 Tax=Roridomyces roridus TaxID=1738132 RepID=A0AAD7B528_9AGAR|nr:hypothetical protein FB45DRAFT_1037845 [Roridomyces roridus]
MHLGWNRIQYQVTNLAPDHDLSLPPFPKTTSSVYHLSFSLHHSFPKVLEYSGLDLAKHLLSQCRPRTGFQEQSAKLPTDGPIETRSLLRIEFMQLGVAQRPGAIPPRMLPLKLKQIGTQQVTGATNAAALARKEMIRRCWKSIDKIGYDAWLQTWRRRHPGESPPSELGHTEDDPPPASIVVSHDDENEYDNLEMFAQSRLSGTKLERWTQRREARHVRDMEELEWAQETAQLDAVLVGNAPDGHQGGVDGGEYFLV